MRIPRPSRRLAFRLAAAALSLCLSIVAGEFALRAIRPGYAPLFLDIFGRDQQGLLGLRPGVTRRHVTDEWDVTVAINGDGLRDVERVANDGRATILGLGDSLAFGWGVELEETLLSTAERDLAANGVRIVKAGIPGSGPLDQLQWLRAYGDACAPDVLVLSFFVGNDFVDVQRGGMKAQFDVRDGLLVRRISADAGPPSRERRLREFVKRRSLLAQQAARLYWACGRDARDAQNLEHTGLNRGDGALCEFFQIHLARPPQSTMQAVERTLRVLDEIRGWCGEREIPLLLVIVPRSFQVYGWEIGRWVAAFGGQRGALDLDRPQRVLGEWAAAREVALLDLLPRFREQAAQPGHERLYFYPDAHLNAAGHRAAGRLLAKAIARTDFQSSTSNCFD